jgi:hypothetical protein
MNVLGLNTLGVAIWIKTDDKYNGTCINIEHGEVFVGIDKYSSKEHRHLQRIIYKTHDKFPDEMPNVTYGYLARDNEGIKFINRITANKAKNIKVTSSDKPIYSYDIDFGKELDESYVKEYEAMISMLKTKYKVQDITETFYG